MYFACYYRTYALAIGSHDNDHGKSVRIDGVWETSRHDSSSTFPVYRMYRNCFPPKNGLGSCWPSRLLSMSDCESDLQGKQSLAVCDDCLHSRQVVLEAKIVASRRVRFIASRKESNSNGIIASVYNTDYLLQQSRWIRDDLDLQVARDGPDALHSNDVLTLDEFLRRLQESNISAEDIRVGRLHLAIAAIAGQATRWPTKLIDKAQALKDSWEARHGPLNKMKAPLYEAGGRLHGICKPEDITMESMLVKWLKTPGMKVSPLMARQRGDMGFRPGE